MFVDNCEGTRGARRPPRERSRCDSIVICDHTTSTRTSSCLGEKSRLGRKQNCHRRVNTCNVTSCVALETGAYSWKGVRLRWSHRASVYRRLLTAYGSLLLFISGTISFNYNRVTTRSLCASATSFHDTAEISATRVELSYYGDLLIRFPSRAAYGKMEP